MPGLVLDDRGVVEVAGPDASALLHRLITNDVRNLDEGQARYAALLTPQGKILADFLVLRRPHDLGFWLDCPLALVASLTKSLSLYKLRAAVTIADRSISLAVAAFWSGLPVAPEGAVSFHDPRHSALGWRMVFDRAAPPAGLDAGMEDYHHQRILAGVPAGGLDFAYGETFPHDANLDRMQGIDFKKGCYVGQEVVSRVEHRGSARKRILPVGFAGAGPVVGAEVRAGESVIGTMGLSLAGHGLAMLRIDRVAESLAAGIPVMADGIVLDVTLP